VAATRLRTVEARLLVEFSQFVLFDYFSDARITDLTVPQDSDWIGHTGHGGAIFHAADQSLEAHVRLEVWSEAPPVDSAAAERQFEGVFTSDSGRVILASVTSSPRDVVVELPRSGEHHVRAIRLGKTEATDDGGQEESWLLMVWPN
jgi:hypothetical protein